MNIGKIVTSHVAVGLAGIALGMAIQPAKARYNQIIDKTAEHVILNKEEDKNKVYFTYISSTTKIDFDVNKEYVNDGFSDMQVTSISPEGVVRKIYEAKSIEGNYFMDLIGIFKYQNQEQQEKILKPKKEA